MAELIYMAIASLDGYVADADGSFDWAEPDEQVHSFINDLVRPIGTYLYGRRMYDVMTYWESPGEGAGQSAVTLDFAEIWQAADKVVYSTSLASVSSARTRIEQAFNPADVERLKESARQDLAVGGPTLAAQAMQAGLVDELQLFVTPVIVGGGTPWLPPEAQLKLELVDHRRFDSGVVYLDYRCHVT